MMPSARACAWVYAALTACVCLFQLALALGAPWGEFAMGGAVRGAFPPAMRVSAIVQLVLLAGLAWVVLARAGVTGGVSGTWGRRLIWVVVGISVLSSVLNLITPSGAERMIWAPVALTLLAASLRVAVSR